MANRIPARDSALRWVLLVVLLTLPVMVVRAVSARRTNPNEQLEPLRQSLHSLRTQLDSCRVDASDEEEAFRLHSDAADSLGARLRDLEGLHPEGVPADSYPVYLDVFREYNDAVSGWDAKAENAQQAWQECRELTEEHNRLADSLRLRLVDLGLWPAPGEVSP